jgi:hypothetical protein
MQYSVHCPLVVSLAAIASLAARPAEACTVFTMTGGGRVLFCDNEDFSNPRTRIWFISGSPGKHGCVLLGFDDGWGQNGLNDKGLAFGWVAGFKERWERRPEMKNVQGNSSQRMLETCSTVDDAIAFYKRHWEESFSYGQLLVADRSGKSVVLRAKNGQLHAPVVEKSQGIGHRFGLRGTEAIQKLADVTTPTVPAAVELLQFTRQEGVNATKYSVVFDLQACHIHLYPFPDRTEPVEFHLSRELEKGPHYFDIPALPKQLSEPLRQLTDDMKEY